MKPTPCSTVYLADHANYKQMDCIEKVCPSHNDSRLISRVLHCAFLWNRKMSCRLNFLNVRKFFMMSANHLELYRDNGEAFKCAFL